MLSTCLYWLSLFYTEHLSLNMFTCLRRRGIHLFWMPGQVHTICAKRLSEQAWRLLMQVCVSHTDGVHDHIIFWSCLPFCSFRYGSHFVTAACGIFSKLKGAYKKSGNLWFRNYATAFKKNFCFTSSWTVFFRLFHHVHVCGFLLMSSVAKLNISVSSADYRSHASPDLLPRASSFPCTVWCKWCWLDSAPVKQTPH